MFSQGHIYIYLICIYTFIVKISCTAGCTHKVMDRSTSQMWLIPQGPWAARKPSLVAERRFWRFAPLCCHTALTCKATTWHDRLLCEHSRIYAFLRSRARRLVLFDLCAGIRGGRAQGHLLGIYALADRRGLHFVFAVTYGFLTSELYVDF